MKIIPVLLKKLSSIGSRAYDSQLAINELRSSPQRTDATKNSLTRSFCLRVAFQVDITLSSHDVNGLSQRDIKLAKFIDSVHKP